MTAAMTTRVSQYGLGYPVQHTPSPAENAVKRLTAAVPKIMLKLVSGL